MAFTAGQKIRASQMSVHVCTSATRPIGHSGQLIYETDTAMLVMYSGSAWYPVLPTGEIASDGQYQASINQVISNNTDTPAAFGMDKLTTPLITKGTQGVGHYFQLNRAGRWLISATVRWVNTATGGERFASVQIPPGTNIASQGVLKAATASAITFNLTSGHRVSAAQAGTSAARVILNVYQFSGADQILEANDGGAWGRLNIAWLGP